MSMIIVAKEKPLIDNEGRREWENAFNACYIQPVLENLDQVLMDTLDIIANDDKQGMHYLQQTNNECLFSTYRAWTAVLSYL